jgi:hypothetical protein
MLAMSGEQLGARQAMKLINARHMPRTTHKHCQMPLSHDGTDYHVLP